MSLRRRTSLVGVMACVVLGWVAGFARAAGAARVPVILISLDAFRWDYCARYPAATPHLRQLMAEGVHARGLIPVFPSNTFPNHYSIVTGLYPSHHGIINNHLFDPAFGEFFHYNRPASARDGRWWGGEPVWVTAEKQGRHSACALWPGSEAEIGGVRPSFSKPYDYSVPFATRLDEAIGWLKLPAETRADFLAFYLEEANSVGHRNGPDSPELVAAVALIDACIGQFTARLAAEHIAANLVIVSDHGMTPVSADRVVLFDDYLDLATVQIDFDEAVAGLRPLPGGDVSTILGALAPMPHVHVYRAEDLPARLHVDAANPRVPPVWIVPDEGWQVARRSLFLSVRDHFQQGQHGYDPALASMHGIFLAHGPGFRRGVELPEFENVHIYNLLCRLLDLRPAPNDGDDRLARAALRR